MSSTSIKDTHNLYPWYGPQGFIQREYKPPQTLGGSSFSPDDLDNMQGWWVASEKVLNGSDVSELTDQSGLGNDLTQGTAADQPVWNSSDANFNNEPSVTFDGVSETLELTAFAAGDLTQPTTIITVASFDGGSHGDLLMSSQNAFRRHEISILSSKYNLHAGSSIAGTSTPDTNVHIWVGVFNTTASKLYIDGGTAEVSGNAGTNDLRGFIMSGGNAGSTHIDTTQAETILYNDLLTNSEINSVGNYLADKYGLSWTDI